MLKFLERLLFGADRGQVKSAIEAGALLVDVRTPSEYASGHVKGSMNIPLESIPKNLSKFKNREPIVVFCRSGARSAQAKVLLNQSGFQHVINGGSWSSVNKLVSNN
ncbi:MAG TPA: rhodanese-like domain-containing protein [Saprospiraceae bacterium]|nr:rhodanese-like domain-containing protein [Saprospiraceae bacterium]HNT21920.1 rhodanese-like domain-containing protein [Saprospiraceae bacterium]